MDEFAGRRPVPLEELLAEREAHAFRQRRLLAEHPGTLISFCLNIPGPYKAFPLAMRCFREGMRSILLALEAENIKLEHEEWSERDAGYTAYFCTRAPPELIKSIAVNIEEIHPLGRLFDIDVFRQDGGKLSRGCADGGNAQSAAGFVRACLVCGGNAFICARSGAHGPGEVRNAMLAIMYRWLRAGAGDAVEAAAFKAMIGEAAITPKPGLVDRANSGAHSDMDFFSFIDSSVAIVRYFRQCAFAGFDSLDEHSPCRDPVELFNSLRHGGKAAEIAMLRSSGGANTHRGLIFSLGILSAAYGRLFRAGENSLDGLLRLCREMTLYLMDDFSASGPETAKTHGELLYARYGISGPRGEAIAGFPHAREGLSYLHSLLKAGCKLNDAGAALLLRFMAVLDDTNLARRGGMAALRRIQEDLSAFLAPEPPMEEILRRARELDGEFIRDGLSPGGSADMLAITLFLYALGFCGT
ncbi:MAG: citrate lyase holo-[acyl-carrier protein] synthase [Treponema sp.]|jgi:holo-ACP synthase/triphosphoribosyl-dephospho-CoA synthase|nr:citrate lyase holo-[acyl-carrier protein] synthase [Treponema sp.]